VEYTLWYFFIDQKNISQEEVVAQGNSTQELVLEILFRVKEEPRWNEEVV
jgi:hypothetical protein